MEKKINTLQKDYNNFDLHRPYIDDVILVSSKGEKGEKMIEKRILN